MRSTPSFLVGVVLILCLAGTVAAQAPGRWTADAKTGCKVWNARPQPRETVSWDGPCKGGIANGVGVSQWMQDGKVLGRTEAEFRNGRPEGRGLSYDKDGNRTEGEFVGGELNGRGIFTLASGGRVVANFVNNKMHGRGVLTLADGGKIDADFENGEMARGSATYADGTRYEGEFKNFKWHGRGKILFKNGGQYEGDFADNEFHGQGILIFANGDRYEGGWNRNRPHGQGTSRIAGRANSGLWDMGCLSQANSETGRWATLITGAAACGFQ
jgi:hypothetical protein